MVMTLMDLEGCGCPLGSCIHKVKTVGFRRKHNASVGFNAALDTLPFTGIRIYAALEAMDARRVDGSQNYFLYRLK